MHYSTDSVAPKPAEAHTHRANSELRCPNHVHRLRTRYHYLFIGARAPPSSIDCVRRHRRTDARPALVCRTSTPKLPLSPPTMAGAHEARQGRLTRLKCHPTDGHF